MRHFKRDLWPTLTLFGSRLRQHIQQGGRKLRALLPAFARRIRQPSAQYRIALFLATTLAFLLGWPLFLSMLPHVS